MNIFLAFVLVLHFLTLFTHLNYLRTVVYPRFESRSRSFDATVVILTVGFIVWVLALLL
jgi:hypothetical protein